MIGAQPSKVSLPSSNVHTRNRDFPKALSPLLPSVQKPLVLKYLKKWVLVTKSSVLPQTQIREQSSHWQGEMKKSPSFPVWPELLSRIMMKAKAQGAFEILLASAMVSCAELNGLGNPGYRLDS